MQIMKKLLFMSLLAILVLVAGCKQATRVLVVVGGHAYDTTEFYDMFRALEAIEFDSVSHPRALDVLASDQIQSYDVLLFYDFLPGMDLKDSTIYLDLGNKGKPLLFMHHSLCSFQDWEGYNQMVGGKYLMPGFGNDSTQLSDYAHDLKLEVQVLDEVHPVTKGIHDFQIRDEGYSSIRMNAPIMPHTVPISPSIGLILPMRFSHSILRNMRAVRCSAASSIAISIASIPLAASLMAA